MEFPSASRMQRIDYWLGSWPARARLGFYFPGDGSVWDVRFVLSCFAAHIIRKLSQWPIQKIISRQQTSQIPDGSLEKTDNFIIDTDAPIDVRDVVNDLVDNLRILHDKSCGECICSRSSPTVAGFRQYTLRFACPKGPTNRELDLPLLSGNSSSFGNAYLVLISFALPSIEGSPLILVVSIPRIRERLFYSRCSRCFFPARLSCLVRCRDCRRCSER